jgi:hypothetical protein
MRRFNSKHLRCPRLARGSQPDLGVGSMNVRVERMVSADAGSTASIFTVMLDTLGCAKC